MMNNVGGMVDISIIIPAFNEEDYIGATIEALRVACDQLVCTVEILVVDNGSNDATVQTVREFDISLVYEPSGGVSSARNAGARAATGRYLVFVDADVIVSPWALAEVWNQILTNDVSVAGMRAIYEPEKLVSWFICAYWDWKRFRGGACQGVAQLYKRNIFFDCGGFDESLHMAEDFDLYARASELDKNRGGTGGVWLRDAIVWPSSRRYNSWSNVRMLFLQNALVVKLGKRRSFLWRTWFHSPLR